MKKTLLLLAALAFILVPSCTKQVEEEPESEDLLENVGEEGGEQQGGTVEFEATLLETKTYLGTPTGSAGSRQWPNLWSNGDVINVHGIASKALKTGDGYVGTNYARFTMNSGISAVDGNYYSAYPSSKVSWNSGSKTATVTIPATQTFTSGSYDPSAYIMVGSSSTQKLNFNPVMGLIQLTTTAPEEGTLYIKSITVEPVGDEKMSGAFTTNYSTISASGSATSSVTISANTGSGSNATKTFGTVFTFAVPAQNYASGVRVTITANTAANGNGDDKTMVFSKQSAFDVKAGKLYPLTAPAFKENGTVSWQSDGVYVITSSSIVCRWTCSNKDNLKKKAWNIHIYSNSECTSEVAAYHIPAIESIWNSNRKNNDYLSYVVGRLSPGTNYWVVVEDNNGIKTSAKAFTTEAFTVKPMPASISSTGVAYAENFGEIGWGSTHVRTAVGYVPNTSGGRSSFDNAYDGSASSFRYSTNEDSFSSTDYNTAIDNSRLSGYLAVSNDVYMKPGHFKMGYGSGHGFIITPEFPIASGKRAKVRVTVDACRFSDASTSTFAVATVHGVNINSSKKHSVDGFSIADVDVPGYYSTLSIPSINATWTSGVADEEIYLINGDRIVFGPSNGTANTAGRCIVKGITVEVTAIEDLPAATYTIKDYSSLSTFLTAAANSSVTGRVTTNINLTSAQVSALASKYPVPGFSGTLYGEGCTISGLTKPLFDDLQGTVDRLVLNSTLNITSDQASIGILANTLSGTVTSCVSRGSVTFDVGSAVTGEHRIGGMIGYVNSNTATVSDCVNEATVTNKTTNTSGSELMVGGIVGLFWGTDFDISGCANTGTVSNTAYWKDVVSVGGIIGQAGNTENQTCNLTVSGCSNSGKVSNSGNSGNYNSVGGVIGWIRYGTYRGNSNTGAISNSGDAPNNYIGGLIGYIHLGATFDDNTNYGDISNSGEATTTNVIGGIIGYAGKNCTLGGHKFINRGDIENSGAAPNIFIGGLLGRNSAGYFNMTVTSWGAASINYGNITESADNRSKASGKDICVGGIAGYTTTGIKMQYARNYGTLYVTGLKGNSPINVGGIGGWISNNSFNFNNCRNEGNITVDCNTTNSLWVGGIAGCVKAPTSTDPLYYYACKATIDTHGATVSGQNYTAGFIGDAEDSNADTWRVYGWRFDGTVWGSKTTAGLLICTTNSASAFKFSGGSDHPTTFTVGSVRKDNTNNNTVNSNSDLNIGILAGGDGSGSSSAVSTAITNGDLEVGDWW